MIELSNSKLLFRNTFIIRLYLIDNILKQLALGQNNDGFVCCTEEVLSWTHRRYLIIEELLRYQPDIICLQVLHLIIFDHQFNLLYSFILIEFQLIINLMDFDFFLGS